MEQAAQRIFYTSINADIPTQKHFFVYNPDTQKNNKEKTPILIWWDESQVRSYDDWLSDLTIRWLFLLAWGMQYIPFVEQLFVAWSPTFWKTTWIVDLVVVSNTKRTWVVKIFVKMCVFFHNMLYAKKTWNSLRLSLVIDRVWSDCSWIRKWVWDLMSPYWIAHLVTIYEQYENSSRQFFESNAWISYTLPKHPLCSVINLWLKKICGHNRIRRSIEWLLAWWVGDWLDTMLFQIHLFIQKSSYRYEKTCRATPWVWGDVVDSKRSLLKWKVSKKMGDS